MKRKINITLSLIALFAVLASTIGITLISYNLFESQVTNDLRIDAELLKDSGIFDNKRSEIQPKQFRQITSEKLRITWVDEDGTVLYDNDTNAQEMENHGNRPEIQEAFAGGSGECVRQSDTFQMNTYYYALMLENRTVVRVSMEANAISSVFLAALPAICLIAVITLIISLIISRLLTRQILQPINRMAENIEQDVSVEIEYDELKPFADKIKSQHKNILEAAKSRQDFTANVSHELKTPLTAISGYAELIENRMAKKDQEIYFASQIHANADRLVSMINEIIKLSELDHSEIEREFEVADLLNIACDVCDNMQMNAQQRNVELSCSGTHIKKYVEKSLISEMITNLVQNAIMYNRDGGHVLVNVSDRNGKAKISVKDDGIGIPEEEQKRIFERFYRVDKGRSRDRGGTGLGLAIVRHVAEIHNAEITINSSLGEGTEIIILI